MSYNIKDNNKPGSYGKYSMIVLFLSLVIATYAYDKHFHPAKPKTKQDSTEKLQDVPPLGRMRLDNLRKRMNDSCGYQKY